ncbi:DUF1120 domain-containing protein [Herbaspirillum rhizosphaerae]|uniref:DUF1120 domain-containing protein n=1 Tax=Herbaspirillum rhizosphaerae TaxID=346179 RepID=UPI0009F9F967|nr:DUF1120 domain-containing protein [Herbaspirillum rhizosphaerae]
MNKLITLAALTSTLLASALTHAATTTELKVTGVIRPAACTPSFTGGGTIDYGVIPPNTLSATAPTVLAAKTVPFNITCDAATKIAVRAIDNRKASMVPGILATINSRYVDAWAFGLGTAAGKNVGSYRVFVSSPTADGTTPDILSDHGGTWGYRPGAHVRNDGTARISFAPTGSTTPGSYKVFNASLTVQAVIDQTSNLNLTSDVTLDGSATIEVQYL